MTNGVSITEGDKASATDRVGTSGCRHGLGRHCDRPALHRREERRTEVFRTEVFNNRYNAQAGGDPDIFFMNSPPVYTG